MGKRFFLIGAGLLLLASVIVLLLPPPTPRVKRITNPDARLKSAIEEARRRLAEFDAFLARPQPGDRFAVKGRFQTDVGPEYLWIRDPMRSEIGYVGLLDQQPIAFTKRKKGDLLRVPRADVVDWFVYRDGKTIGGFTERALSSTR